ncbi:MAG: SDR family oxidoreductase [Burkholderiales bacterium]
MSGRAASDADCRRIAAEAEARLGRADALVNNAGTTKFVALKDLDDLSAEDFQRIYAVNVIGAWQMSRALVPLLQRNAKAGATAGISTFHRLPAAWASALRSPTWRARAR